MINFDFFYSEKDAKCNDVESYYINNYINKHAKGEYLKNCSDDRLNFYSLYYLSSITQNIINWYEFKPKSNVLQIELELGNIAEALMTKDINLTVVTNSSEKAKAIEKRCDNSNIEIICGLLKDIKFKHKFNYIVLIGNLPLKNQIYGEDISLKTYLNYLKNLLAKDGKFLIAIDNKFAVRSLCGGNDFYTGKKYDSITGYVHSKEKNYSMTESNIKKILEGIGVGQITTYYPLPDFRLPNVIFSEKYLPNSNNFSKYEPYTINDENMLISEIQLFGELLNEDKDLFRKFANSFFIVAGEQKEIVKYKFISFNNMRKEEYRLITKIGDDIVKKDITGALSQRHYENIKRNICILNDEKYDILDSVEKNVIESKYIDSQYMLSYIIEQLINTDNMLDFYELIDSYFSTFFKRAKKIENTQKDVFDKYNIPICNKEKLHYLKNGFWDANFSNCFYIDNKFYLFDQEWNEENLPVEYIIYSAFIKDKCLLKNIDIKDIAKRYNFTDFLEEFKKLDSKLQENIRDENIWNFYAQINLKSFEDYMKEYNEIKNENIRKESRIKHLENELKVANDKIAKFENRFSFKIKKNINKLFRRKM